MFGKQIAAGHRDDRQRDAGGPPTMSGGRHGRLSQQTGREQISGRHPQSLVVSENGLFGDSIAGGVAHRRRTHSSLLASSNQQANIVESPPQFSHCRSTTAY